MFWHDMQRPCNSASTYAYGATFNNAIPHATVRSYNNAMSYVYGAMSSAYGAPHRYDAVTGSLVTHWPAQAVHSYYLT